MDSELYTIEYDYSGLSFEDLMMEHKLELTKQIVNCICKAVDEDKNEIDIARIVTPIQSIVLKSSEPYFESTLKTNLKTLISYEEYELCSKVRKTLIKLLEKKENKNLEV